MPGEYDRSEEGSQKNEMDEGISHNKGNEETEFQELIGDVLGKNSYFD